MSAVRRWGTMTVIRHRGVVRLRVALWALAAAACFIAAVAPAAAQSRAFPRYELADLRALEDAFARTADELRPSVVALKTFRLAGVVQHRGDEAVRSQVKVTDSVGAGVVFRSDGYILTNQHVVATADEITVMMYDGRTFDGKLVMSDVRSDLAVLKIEADHLQAARLGDAGRLRAGHWALALGNPFGLATDDGNASLAVGTISAVNRDMTSLLDPHRREDRYYGNLIETSARINPGNSGGPLFNLQGEVVGIVTAVQSGTDPTDHLGYAIPMDRITRSMVDTLARGERVRYGYLGVEPMPVPSSLRALYGLSEGGARIEVVHPNTPAERAHLRPDDVIVDFNGVEVQGVEHLVRLVGSTPVGSVAKVGYVRDQQRRAALVTLDDRPPHATD